MATTANIIVPRLTPQSQGKAKKEESHIILDSVFGQIIRQRDVTARSGLSKILVNSLNSCMVIHIMQNAEWWLG